MGITLFPRGGARKKFVSVLRRIFLLPAEPAIMPIQRLPFLADDRAEPLADDRAVDVVVVDPPFVAGVVWRVDVNTLYLTEVVRTKGLERFEVVALDKQVSKSRVAFR